MTRFKEGLCTGIIAMLILTACGDGNDSGAPSADAIDDTVQDDDSSPEASEGEPIVVGGIFDMSGPTSDIGNPYGAGAQAYFACLNAQDGIQGRSVDLRWQDYQYDVGVSEQLYTQFRSEGAVAIIGWGTADTEALRSLVAEDEIPFISGAAPEAITDPAESPYNFPLFTSYSDQLRLTLNWIAEREDGPTEVAVLHNDSPFGTAPLEDGRAYIEDNGLDINYETYVMASGATDFGGEIAQFSDQNPDYIYVQNITSPAAQLARDLQSQGVDATMIVFSWGADELFIELAGDAAEGVFGIQPFAPPSANRPGHETIRECVQGEEAESVRFVTGWYAADILTAAISDVLEAGTPLDGAAVKDALEAMEPLDTGGVSAPISYTSDDHKPMTASDIYVVIDGEWTASETSVKP